jgi:two-component system, chemotaxis family, chemotaxis protein CheY
MRCLIVEDNAIMREIMCVFLADYADIVTACNGREGVRFFTRAYEEGNPFDMVLLDVIMPEMDGQMALKLMRLVEKGLPAAHDKRAVIIMTTALDSAQDVKGFQGDCTDYLVKPVARAELRTMLRRYELIN